MFTYACPVWSWVLLQQNTINRNYYNIIINHCDKSFHPWWGCGDVTMKYQSCINDRSDGIGLHLCTVIFITRNNFLEIKDITFIIRYVKFSCFYVRNSAESFFILQQVWIQPEKQTYLYVVSDLNFCNILIFK